MHKRQFIKLSGMVAAGAVIAPSLTFCGNPEKKDESDKEETSKEIPQFTLPALAYSFDALEPHIDARTMEIHHDKHHAGYTSKFNDALAGNSAYAGMTLEEILAGLKGSDDQTALRNNGGGYYNHALYWDVMGPNGGGDPTGNIAEAINSAFGSFEDFKSAFSKEAGGVFGSGWAWLSAGEDKKLHISSTPNQDNPLMKNLVEHPGTPVLGIDVWEHAYYLKHQNKRTDYIDNFFNVINWDNVNKRFALI